MSILRFIHWIIEGYPVILFGDGKQSRSFTYVDDVVELLELTLEINKNHTLNVGSNITTKLIEIINLIESITEKKAKIDFQERAYKDPDVVLPNLNLVKKEVNWTPKTTIEIGLEKTIKWYLEHRDEIKNLRYL
jgi:UDP-glucuronate 4-epimerase